MIAFLIICVILYLLPKVIKGASKIAKYGIIIAVLFLIYNFVT